MQLLGPTAMLKDNNAINDFLIPAAGPNLATLSKDEKAYFSAYNELEIIGKEFEQTSRRLVHLFAFLRSGGQDEITSQALGNIMRDYAGTADLSKAAASEFGTGSRFSYSQFMDFLEYVDADEEAEHPDFAIVEEI